MYMISWGEVQYHSCEWYGSSTKEAIVRDHSYTVCFKDEMNHNKIGGTKTISVRPRRDIQTLTIIAFLPQGFIYRLQWRQTGTGE